MATHMDLKKLLSRLGALDAEKRAILEKIKKSPEYTVKMAKHLLDDFVKTNKWFLRKGEVNKSYRKIISYRFINEKPYLSKAKQRPVLDVELEWLVYDEAATTSRNDKQTFGFSVFADLETQLKNGMTIVPFDEKTIKKNMLLIKEKELKDALAKVRTELKAA